MKGILKTFLFCSLLSVFTFSCVSVPKQKTSTSTKSVTVVLDIETQIKELRGKIVQYELEIYDVENFGKGEVEYKVADELITINEGQKIDKETKAKIDASLLNAYEYYKLTYNNGMPMYANAQRTSALKERDKANSIISHRTANPEYEGAALVFLQGEDEMLTENYEVAAADYIEARVGYEKAYNIAKALYEKSSASIKELDNALKEIDTIQAEIDSYQVSN